MPWNAIWHISRAWASVQGLFFGMTKSPLSCVPLLLLAVAVGLLAGCDPPTETQQRNPFPDRIDLDRAGETWAASTLSHLTLEQKVGQLFSVPAPVSFGASDSPENLRVLELVRDLHVGGVIFFQGTPLSQASVVNDLQAAAAIPLLISQDMETGAGMRLTGATRLPSAMAIAASGDPDLAYLAGRVTAAEARAVGVRQVLAPVADVNANAGNPVIDTRSFSDQPGIAAVMVDAFVRGLQQGGTLATAKHFPGHGATSRDSHFSMPVLNMDYARLDSVDLVPFRAAIAAGASSVMTAHVAYPNLDGGRRRPATLAPPLVNGILRDSLGFDGLIVSDALNMAGVQRGTPGSVAVDALMAGVDMLMMSTNVRAARRAILSAVERGTLSEADLDAKVSRILRAKAAAGLHRARFTPLNDVRRNVANAEQRAITARIARAGITLLGDSSAAPISDKPGRSVFVLALSDRSIADRHREFVDALQERLPDVTIRSTLVGSTDVSGARDAAVRAARNADELIILAYASASTWRLRPQTAARFRGLMSATARAAKRSHLVVFGTPYVAEDAPARSTVYLAYGDGLAEQRAAADAVTGRADVSGRTPVLVSAQIPVGSGSSRAARYPRAAAAEEVDMDGRALVRIESLLERAIDERAFPGAAVAVGRAGAITHLAGYGTHTYVSQTPVTAESSFDLASLTKVIATTTAVMQLYEQGRIDLDAPASRYLHDFGRNGKEDITIRQLLTHTAGLTPFKPFYSMGLRSRGRVLDAIYDEPLVYEPGSDSRYSDFGPIILAEIVSRVSRMGFATYAMRHIFEPLGMWHTGFRAVGRGAQPDAVPTENDQYFRFRVLQGEVHDENAWIMGGVAGHAGLFSTVSDLTRFANMMISEGRVGNEQFLQPETIRLFTTAFDTTGTHTRALGWDTKSPEGYSSAGQSFGPRSFGHTGFTGTSIWFDPDVALFVILLTNRVYPTRNNRGHISVRPALANLVHETLRDPSGAVVTD
jgi:beta-glucosidase-like glycosyl hydrolase/CubicO group peptidase (beta-lactamase class C family)